jgi:hypothetical protein
MSQRIERRRVAAARVGVGLTKFDKDFTDKGGDDPFVPDTNGTVMRVRPVLLGKRATGFFSGEIDELIEALRAFRDAAPRVPPKPAVAAEFHPSRHRKSRKQEARHPP